MSRKVLLTAILLIFGLTAVQPVESAIPPGFSDVVLFATNSIHLKRSVQVTGDVVANDASAGPFLDEGVELAVDRNAHVAGDAKADSIDVDNGGTIKGGVFCNEGSGVTCSGLSLPVFVALPTFQTSSPGTEDVSVGSGESLSLPARSYGHVSVAGGGTLILEGGIYNFQSLSVGNGGSLFADAASDVRVADDLSAERDSVVGPNGGAVTAAEIVFYVGGLLADIGRDASFSANLYVPNGLIQMGQGTDTTGAFLAFDILVDKNSTVDLDTFFFNRPPTADTQDVFTTGLNAIELTLTGSDPENDDLTFSIDTPPTSGNLSAITEDPPPFPGDPPGCNPINVPGCIPPDPPRTSATVTYTPKVEDTEDSFVFKVTDTAGNMATAVVRINTGGDPQGDVFAFDTSVDTDLATPVTVGLTGDAPEGVVLTFSILSGPSDGDLGTITPISDVAANVDYTPDVGFEGQDSFDFEACGLIGTNTVCDSATATITVSVPDGGDPPPGEDPVADDQNVVVEMEESILITLTGQGGNGFAGPEIKGAAPPETAPGTDRYSAARGEPFARVEGAGAGRGPIPDPYASEFDNPVDFLDQVEGAVFYDFEAPEFPTDGYIGVVDDINFDARTITSSQSTSGDQSMTGDTGTFGTAVVDFVNLDTKPNAFAFTGLDLTQIGEEVIEALVHLTSGPPQIFDAQLDPADPAFTPKFLGVIFDDNTIEKIVFRGTEANNRTTDRAWLLDDLIVGGIEGGGELTYSIITLPSLGILNDSNGDPVAVGVTLPGPDVTYTPDPGVSGVDFFVFKITDQFGGMATATVTITIVDPGGCTDCYTLTVILQGTGVGDVTTNPTGVFCPGTCAADFPQNSSLVLQARPIENGTFGGYGGDCSGSSPLLTLLMDSDKVCTATINAAP